MRRLLIFVVAALVAAGGAGVVAANPPQDENGRQANDHGLCTAYFNGQKKGHDKNGQPGPFEDLTQRAEDNTDGPDGEPGTDDDPEGTEAIFAFCGGLIGGNSEHGRYTCANDPNADDGVTCTDNPDPNERNR